MIPRTWTTALAAVCLASSAAVCPAQSPLKQFVLEEVVNEDAKIMIRVDVDHPDRTYYEGEELTVKVIAEKDCYIHIVDINPAGEPVCLFPNSKQPNNFIKGGVEVHVPAEGDTFRLRARAPFGEEVICVVATLKPGELFQGKNLRAARVTPLSAREVRGMKGAINKQFVVEPDRDWAEHRVVVKTVAGKRGDTPVVPKPGQRLAVCIGISDYKDPRITDLKVSHKDAERMSEALKQYCGVADPVLLTESRATRAAIRKAVFEDMRERSRPGDTIFIYFSGHGGRCADTNGDETDGDGMDEYLVPYDGVLANPEETMIIDDEFGRWINELQGRQILVILDNCYSGGATKGLSATARAKAARGSKALPDDAEPQRPGLVIGGREHFDFLDKEVLRSNKLKFRKDIEGAGTVLLAASKADQIAFEMPSGEGSVLTYYMIKSLGDRGGRLTAPVIFDSIREPIETYVKQTFMTDQNPVLVGEAPGLIVRP